MTTNEFERDLNDQAGLKRPGRIDLRVLQNTADAGDGHPGVQRCFRNYLHEGGMEKDIDLVGYGIKGTSVLIDNAELQQLSNIGAVTISGAQWGYVGGADQPVKQADSPTFGGLTVNGHITITGNVDGVDVGDLKTAFDTHKASTGSDHTYIDQSLTIISSPRFVNLNIEGVIQHFGDADNEIQFAAGTQTFKMTAGYTALDLNVSGLRIGGANVRVTGIIDSDSLGTSDVVLCTQGNVKAYVDASHQDVSPTASPTFVGLTLSADVVTTSTFDGVDVGDLKTAFDTHKASTGSDHSYINQDVTTSGEPNFAKGTFGVSESSNYIVSMANYYPSGPANILFLDFTNEDNVSTGNKYIIFENKDGEVGAIHSEVIYGTFTGSHDSQTNAADLNDWEIGMIVIATGKLIGKPSMGRALPKCDLSRKRQDKCVFGVYNGMQKKHNKKGLNKKKPSLYINSLGEGQILVTNTNGNIAVGDYIQSSEIHGLGEKQDDDILHNYTVAKATQPVNWNRIKTKNGIKKKLIGCTYHCG